MRYSQSALRGELEAQIQKDFERYGIDAEPAKLSQTDWSAEATADRIVTFATAFLQTFKDTNPDLEPQAAEQAYAEKIRSVIGEGYAQALEVLEGMGASEEVFETAQKTIDLVAEKLSDFFGDAEDAG